MRQSMPFLLTESLDRDQREQTHQHIESCAVCGSEWAAYRDTWGVLGELPKVEVPARVRDRFLVAIGAPAAAAPVGGAQVVAFHRRSAARWLAQAAAVVVIAGGAYFAGHRTVPVTLAPTGPVISSITPFSIAETRVLSASAINPNIEGRPNIQNVQFVDADPNDNTVGLSFDVTSRMTVTGSPTDKSLVRLLSYVLENEDGAAPSRSRTIDWVKQTYSEPGYVDPEIANALAKVLRNDEHEGVRIRAVDTLTTLSGPGSVSTRDALIEALKNDPNPAVRIKAVEALANMARSGSAFDSATVATLRQKAAQDDENLYVRVKAAEVLSSIRP
ncbi:MAG TPA: HEAT repeat domain-containing protein [Thermoanaerobaculia bacterium]|nr:HEAT repeat domain-containing protein [Thermoanaerobaculia bacterium]